MMLRRSNSLLALSLAIFVAGIAGVQLGQSAIGGINPVHFQGVPLQPKAVDGRERQPGQPEYYQAYNWEEGAAARAIACGDNCGPPERYDPYSDTEAAPRLAHWADRESEVELEPWPAGQVSRDRRPALMRYADYPIEAKPEAAEDEGDERADYQRADVYEDD